MNPVRLAPCTHDPSIVHGNDDHQIDTFALDIVQMFNIAGQMTNRAAWCESARHGDEDDFLLCKFGTGIELLRNAAGCDGGFFFGVRHPTKVRQSVAIQCLSMHRDCIPKFNAFGKFIPFLKRSHSGIRGRKLRSNARTIFNRYFADVEEGGWEG